MLSHYRLVEKIGEGGMGVVWKATDTTLDRDVAIKILPAEFAADAERLGRFEREARLLASLNHPNIATIHGLHDEPSSGIRFIAMELVAGEDLAGRLARGPLDVEDALAIATGVAAALEAAHESGVIHRDLKPANIQLAGDSKVKVLDFGLAKALTVTESEGGGTDPSASPTVTSAGTVAGMILGTAAYMSPEQARGKPIDRRSDVWSFGCVLFEMLTGASPFRGDTVSDSIGAILNREPDWSLLPASTPPSVRRLARRCLVRDREMRLQHIGDARVELLDRPAEEQEDGESVTADPSTRTYAPWLPWALAVAALVASVAIWIARSPAVPPPTVTRFEIDLEREGKLDLGRGPGFAISQDGTRLALVIARNDSRTLFVRELGESNSKSLVTARLIHQPFFSPDGRWIGYFTADTLNKIAVSGGLPIVLAEVSPANRGGSWGPDDTIVYAPDTTSPLMRISAEGGTPEAITTKERERGERSHRWPAFVPGHPDRLVFTSETHDQDFDESSIEILDLSTGARHVLHEGGSYGRVTPNGTLLFTQNGSLFATRLSSDLTPAPGAPRPVIYNLSASTGNGGAQLAFSGDGTLIYVEGERIDSAHVLPLWIDLDGTESPVLPEPEVIGSISISADGSRLAWQESFRRQKIMVHELRRGISAPLTSHPFFQMAPIWSPDGDRIVFTTRSKEHFVGSLFLATVGVDEPPVRIGKGSVSEQFASDWSPDGAKILFDEPREGTKRDILVYDLASTEVEVFVATAQNDTTARFSPDGMWVAFVSDVTEANEVYLRRFEGDDARTQVSISGGVEPVWAPDGSAIYYLAGNVDTGGQALMRVARDTTSEPPTLSAPVKVLDLELIENRWGRRYDVDPSGRRFIALRNQTQRRGESPVRIHVVMNWFAVLERELGAVE